MPVRITRRLCRGLDLVAAPWIDPARAIVVSGFWRSGTTWLQAAVAEMARGKRIYEPLHVSVPEASLAHRLVAHRSVEFRELFLPFARDDRLEEPLRGLFESALRGRSGGARYLRDGLGESLRSRVVLKLVRGQFCLRALRETFGCRVLHVRRDPRAVVASIRLTGWSNLFDHLQLAAQLLEVPDGRAELFARWEDEIRRTDEEPPLSRIAGYWAITERFVEQTAGDAVILGYESVCREPALLADALRKLGSSVVAESRTFERDSPTTSPGRRHATLDERISGWRSVLSADETRAIEATVRRFGFDGELDRLSA